MTWTTLSGKASGLIPAVSDACTPRRGRTGGGLLAMRGDEDFHELGGAEHAACRDQDCNCRCHA